MADLIILLGDILFQEHEIPPRINFGGAQALGTQQLVGGGRKVDSMGAVDDDISFSGMFFSNANLGLEALPRARQLNTLRTLGLELEFIYYDMAYLVKIADFKANFERYYQIPYSITLKVVQDLSLPASPLNDIQFLDAILGDLNLVNAGAQILNDSTLNGLINNFTASLNVAGTLESASPAVINSLINSGNAVNNQLNTLIGQYKTGLSG